MPHGPYSSIPIYNKYLKVSSLKYGNFREKEGEDLLKQGQLFRINMVSIKLWLRADVKYSYKFLTLIQLKQVSILMDYCCFKYRSTVFLRL